MMATPGRHRAGLDHDVPPAARRAELPAVAVGLPPSLGSTAPSTVIPTLVMVEVWQWTPLVMLIVLGGLASCRSNPMRRRPSTAPALADVPPHHAAAGLAVHRGRLDHPPHRRVEGIRHDLRDHPGRSRHRQRDDQHLPLSAGLRLLRRRLRVSRGRGVLPIIMLLGCAAAAATPPAGEARHEAPAARRWASSAFGSRSPRCWSRRRCCSSSGCCRCRLKNELDNTA